MVNTQKNTDQKKNSIQNTFDKTNTSTAGTIKNGKFHCQEITQRHAKEIIFPEHDWLNAEDHKSFGKCGTEGTCIEEMTHNQILQIDDIPLPPDNAWEHVRPIN
jgi:hypothetical protein